jgi:type VI protein secretion system component Hcp
MAGMVLDAILELTPARKMRTKPVGEESDLAHGVKAGHQASIELKSFRFGNAQSMAKAKEQRDRDKAGGKEHDEKDDAKAKTSQVHSAQQTPAQRTGKKDDDYRFQITKEIENTSPLLMQAFFSNSFKEKRQENNSFSEAKITFRRTGGGATAHKPYLVLTFRGVYIVAYEFETADDELPEETIDFCFQTCEMKYTAQKKTGEADTQPVIRGWNFVSQQDM